MADASDIPGFTPEGFEGDAVRAWIERAVRGALKAENEPDALKAGTARTMEKSAEAQMLEAAALSAAFRPALTLVERAPEAARLGVATLLTSTLSQLTGLKFVATDLLGQLDLAQSRTDQEALGLPLMRFLMNSPDREKIRLGWEQRKPGEGELSAMSAYMGAAMRIQLGGALLKILGKRLPGPLASISDDLTEMIDKSVNLDDAIEELLQVPMEAFVTRGLTSQLLKELKPADLSATEALRARIADKLSDDDLRKILDNLGYRDDIRTILRQNAASNLTESDLNDSYQWNLLSRDEVKKQYRDRAFEEVDAELKTKLVELTRRQKLREKIFELYGNLYRDGVATKQEVTPFLQNYGYDNDEVEMWFSVQELERRQRKWLSDGNLLKLVIAGHFSLTQAIEYLTLQGMEISDATALMQLALDAEKKAEAKELEAKAKAAIKKLPKAVQDKCDDLFSPDKILQGLLTEVLALIPLGGIPLSNLVDLRTLIECALKGLGAPITPPPTTTP